MLKTSEKFRNYKKQFLSVGVFAACAVAILIGLVSAPPSRAQSSAQSAATAPPVLEYEVASIKPYKPGVGEGPGVIRMGIMNAPDAFSATGVTLKDLVSNAYGVQSYQVIGGPDWFGNERLEIDAKMDSAVADVLKNMSAEDRKLARQKMLQALLADRFRLTIHRETKELPAYTLVIGKNGPKLQETKPDDTTPPPGAVVAGRAGRGGPQVSMRGGPGGFTMTAKAASMASLVGNLSQNLHRAVIDKTGLTGTYDFTLSWLPEEFAQLQSSGGASAVPGGAPSGSAPTAEATFPTMQVAVEEQLGLKLESGKGLAETIVIDRAERASGN